MHFCHLTNIERIPEPYVREAINAKYELLYKPTRIKASSNFEKSSLVNLIKKKFRGVQAEYLKNSPRSIYDWHTDIGRQCSINWVLKSNPRAVTMYRTKHEVPDGVKSFTYDLHEVDYTLYRPTIINTTKEHCVINPSDTERIILSLTVFDYSYEEVRDYLLTI